MNKQELHLHAIARLIALQMTDGDKEKAVELLKEWAYNFPIKSPIKEDSTEKLIRQYLEPDADIDSADIAKFISRFIETKRDLDYEAIHDAILDMKASDFYTTAYWISIATYIKGEAKKACQKCGATGKRIKTVYKTKANRGYELLHLDDLECLCEDCVEKMRLSRKDDWRYADDYDEL